jgi:hypothetical protein
MPAWKPVCAQIPENLLAWKPAAELILIFMSAGLGAAGCGWVLWPACLGGLECGWVSRLTWLGELEEMEGHIADDLRPRAQTLFFFIHHTRQPVAAPKTSSFSFLFTLAGMGLMSATKQ